MATPMQKGKEELPNSSVSHRWKILCSGNTSRESLTEVCYFNVGEGGRMETVGVEGDVEK